MRRLQAHLVWALVIAALLLNQIMHTQSRGRSVRVHCYVARSRCWFLCHELYPSRGLEGGELERTSIIQDILFSKFSAR